MGLLLLLGALFAAGGVPQALDDVSTPLLRHLMLLLIPSVAAVGLYAGLLSHHAAAFLLVAVVAGCLASVLSTLLLCGLMGTPMAFALSLAVERAGGVPAVVATGVLGAWLAGPLLRWLRVAEGPQGEVVSSFTLGLVAHAIGVARVLQTHPGSVAFAALAMGLNGIATALVLALLWRWL